MYSEIMRKHVLNQINKTFTWFDVFNTPVCMVYITHSSLKAGIYRLIDLYYTRILYSNEKCFHGVKHVQPKLKYNIFTSIIEYLGYYWANTGSLIEFHSK